ncbi:dienelactone hydrolase family protein [Arenibacter troitsensis]|uniref:Prolyl oligopeptidase family protein n=1 Tax=Arenibacter troitsensis TaxID=188872 RepID=A0A1X7L095_9FLAO|nr:prolyl oligopeptidase family serine peptidase [Arenibacter troitsensis]SMG46914.1 Prolyl oligopeptidase family protein [Arenibacter troitsensis]
MNKSKNTDAEIQGSRRAFISKTAMATAALPLLPATLSATFNNLVPTTNPIPMNQELPKSLIGQYGPWLATQMQDPPKLSFRNDLWSKIEDWKPSAHAKVQEQIAEPLIKDTIPVTIKRTYSYDGLHIEELTWKLPYGRPVEAIFLKPENSTGKLPAILALHDHAGKKYFGKRKITKTSDTQHPLIEAHQESDYEGRAWANEIAKRGYAVLVHDAFSFASRRVYYEDMAEIAWGPLKAEDRTDENAEDVRNIEAYNEWAGHHEHLMAKSLLSAGTTYPGMVLAEDRIALDILSARKDVDAERIGCGGLSGGGLRTVYLGGMDARIKCAVCVGFMSTWKDFLLNKAYTHTWMTYAPGLANYIDFPEILGLRVPLPTMVQSNNHDQLYTLPEMKKADSILAAVFSKAGHTEKYSGKFYDGGHKFDVRMQTDAFDWFDAWLGK